MFYRIALMLLLILGVSMQAEAQVPAAMQMLQQQRLQQQRQQQQQTQTQTQPQPNLQMVNISGTIESITSNGLHVLDGSQQSWQVHVTKETNIQVTGTATPDFLDKGRIVELNANLDEHGKSTDNVKELSIIAPTHDKPQGAVVSGAGSKAKGLQAGMNHIIGRVKSYNANLLIIQAGHSTVHVELTDDPKITVDLADLSLADNDDKVTIKGTLPPSKIQPPQTQPANQPHQIVQAQEVKIVLSQPLTTGKKKKGTPAKSEDSSTTNH